MVSGGSHGRSFSFDFWATAAARLLLQLLGCLVRHALPLVEITTSTLRSLPMQLRATLLIDNELAREPLLRLLSVSASRGCNILLKNGVVNAYGAKVLYRGAGFGDTSFGDAVMAINLVPFEGIIPILTVRDRQDLADKFQPLLLSYRVRNIARVAGAQVSFPNLPKESQLVASLLAACIVDAPEIQAGAAILLEAQHQQMRPARWVDLRCVAIEALLSSCHRRSDAKDVVYVGDIAKDIAAILTGRGETTEIEPRRVGSILRELGLNGKRDRSGYRYVLDESFCLRSTNWRANLMWRRYRRAALPPARNACAE